MRVDGLTGYTVWPLNKPLLELVQKFQSVFRAPDPGALLITLATYAAYRVTSMDPLWLMIVGGPSTLKTETLNLLNKMPRVFLRSAITKAGLLSGTKQKERAANATGGLLHEIGSSGFVAFKDFTTILGMPRDAQSELLDALREIYDGRWSREIGTDGGRLISWEGKMGLIAACTSAIDEQRKMLSIAGDRFLFYRMPESTGDEEERNAMKAGENTGRMQEIRVWLADEAQSFMADVPVALPEPNDDQYENCLAGLSSLIARGRAQVSRDWKREIVGIHAPEGAGRLSAQFHALDIGLALIGVPPIRRFHLVRKTALYSIMPVRLTILTLLAKKEPRVAGSLPGRSHAELVERSMLAESTVYRTLEELRMHGLVRRSGSAGSYRFHFDEEWLERWNRCPAGAVVSQEVGEVVDITSLRNAEKV
jgi:Fe2+ or Zn2+ uptake regulation protein